VAQARQRRRELLRQGKRAEFLKKMEPKAVRQADYIPKRGIEEGGGKMPVTGEEWRRAVDQEHGVWIARPVTGGLPEYLEVWEDEAGCKRCKVKEGGGEQVDKIRSAMSRRGMEGVEVEKLMEKMMEEEEMEMFKLWQNKAPGATGFKMAAVWYLPESMRSAVVEAVNAQLQLALIPEENKVVVIHT